MNPFFKIFGLTKFIFNFEKNVVLHGWSIANKVFIRNLGIKVKSDIKKLDSKSGLLLYSNHPTGLDPYIISSIIDRDDVYILADVYQSGKGKAIGTHIIPVYYSSWSELFSRSGISFFGYILMRLISGTSTRIDARNLNRKAIAIAAKYIKQGKCVIVFPSGGARINLRWKKGIGEIINILNTDEIHFKIYKFIISGFSENRLFWHIVSGRKFLLQKPLNIKGEEVNMEQFKNLTPTEITLHLQQNFYNK